MPNRRVWLVVERKEGDHRGRRAVAQLPALGERVAKDRIAGDEGLDLLIV
jgi:hypothetical protein